MREKRARGKERRRLKWGKKNIQKGKIIGH